MIPATFGAQSSATSAPCSGWSAQEMSKDAVICKCALACLQKYAARQRALPATHANLVRNSYRVVDTQGSDPLFPVLHCNTTVRSCGATVGRNRGQRRMTCRGVTITDTTRKPAPDLFEQRVQRLRPNKRDLASFIPLAPVRKLPHAACAMHGSCPVSDCDASGPEP